MGERGLNARQQAILRYVDRNRWIRAEAWAALDQPDAPENEAQLEASLKRLERRGILERRPSGLYRRAPSLGAVEAEE